MYCREQKIRSTNSIEWLDLTIHWGERQVARGTRQLEIKGLTFDLMQALVHRINEVVTVDELIDSVWQGQPIGNEVVTQRVRMLRRALGDQSTQSQYIETIRGAGYRAMGQIGDASGGDSQIDSGSRARAVVLGAALVIVTLISGVWLWSTGREVGPGAELLERAQFYAGLGQADDALRAIALYRRSLDLEPDNRTAMLGLSFVLSQRVCQHDDSLSLAQEAQQLARSVLAHSPREARAHAALAYADDCVGQIDAALQGYMRAHELDPGRNESLASAAHLLAIKGQLAEALKLNLQAQRSAQPAQLRFGDIQVARILDLMGFDAAAEARYSNTADLYPENIFAAAARVRFLMTRGRAVAAFEAATLAEAMNAGSAELFVLHAELADLRGDTQARDSYLKRAANYPTPGAWAVTLKGLMADRHIDPAWIQERISSVESAISAGDMWPTNWLELAVLWTHLGDSERAVSSLESAIVHGYRDLAYLTYSPWLNELRTYPQFAAQLEVIRSLVNRERDAAITADWWTSDLIRPAVAQTAE